MSEEDVIQHVILCLIEALRAGTQINHPVAWARLVSERYVNNKYKKYRMTEATELDKIEHLATRNNQENRCYEDEADLMQKIEQLKPISKQILIMRFFEGLSWNEIAYLLSKQENKNLNAVTMRKRGERAINELRSYYVNESTA
ncbi:RNA polymerase sigma factor [Anabaena sp. CCY 9910]|uniref:RNA polymerase sigma factor n=1 Tax=Anabaena sp. CCY 9910 TaxID=3103870 RepID=UPI0039DF5571